MCVRLQSANSEPTTFSQRTPDEHPPTRLPCRWPALITLPTLAKFQLVWRRFVMLCCSLPASSNTSLRPSVCYPSISLVVNKVCIRIFCDHLNALYIFDPTCIVLNSGWSATARMPRLVVSPPSLSPPDATAKSMATSHHFTPPRQVSAGLAPLV